MEGAITNDEVIEIPDSVIPCDQSRNNLSIDGSTSPNSIANEQSTILTVGSFSDAKKQSKKPKVMVVVQSKSTLFICIIVLLIATSTITISLLLHLQLWKWFAFVLVTSCSWFITRRMVSTLFFLIERYLVMKTSKILYFEYGLEKSVLYFFRFGSILLAWGLLIGLDAKGSNWINFVTSTLATCLIGTAIWILKIVILKVLACGLYDEKHFDRIRDLISQQYVLQTLLGPSMLPAEGNGTSQLKWITGAYVHMFGGKRLFIICDALDKTLDDDDGTLMTQIFKNFQKNELREINGADLLQVMKEEDVVNFLDFIEVAVERNVIDETCLKNWMVKVFEQRKTLVHLLRDSNTELNTIMSGIVFLLTSIIWLTFMGFATTRMLACIVTLVVFLFGKTCITISEGIIFILLQRPFDRGDRCVIDNEQLIVEEIGILRTLFLTENNKKLYYQNSNLLTKSIINYSRSSDTSDILEFLVDVSTSAETIAALKLKIYEYLQSKPKNYHPEYSLLLEEIEDKKLKFRLHITHAK